MSDIKWSKYKRNLTLPGNLRYQPKKLQWVFGYDNLYATAIEVEWAALKALQLSGVLQQGQVPKNILTEDLKQHLLKTIPTARVDEVERNVTKHDIRALVHCMKEEMPESLHPWVHVPLTSYDVLATAQVLQFKRAHSEVVLPLLNELIAALAEKTLKYADVVQIGRTHGQHAVPITVGFWLATILQRLVTVRQSLIEAEETLDGKISGPVGAYNAQVALSYTEFSSGSSESSFEGQVLHSLGLRPARISTQIAPMEPLHNYLWHCVQLSGVMAQFGSDCRHLMRSEIGEVREAFGSTQVGSSTMAHKRNPISFENLEGMHKRTTAEFGKVMSTMISEHQRDLTGSSVMRDYPIIVVNVVQQLSTLLREKDGKKFIERIEVDEAACRRNLEMSGHAIMAEPFYLALQRYGYEGDAHDIVSHHIMPALQSGRGKNLLEAARHVASLDRNTQLSEALERISPSMCDKLSMPEQYTGLASQRARDIAESILHTDS